MNAGDRPIVVGIDGSRDAEWAGEWAARQARDRGRPLLLVHCLTWPYEGVTVSGRDAEVASGLHSGAESLLRAMADELGSILPRDRIDWRVEQGDPVGVLCTESATADVVVVGARGIGGVAGLLVGSTATALAASAHCPVVVLPDGSTVLASARRSVVVGVEGRGRDEEVLEFAFTEAAARGTDLVAVHVWQDAALGPGIRTVGPLVDWATVAADEQRILAEAIGGWREKQPDVDVREVVVRGRTAASLVAAAMTAELLVVGRPPHGPIGRLGSATHGVLHRAGCPVAVVPVSDTAG